MNALTTTGPARASLEPATLSEAMRFAEVLANSTMVPRDYQGKPANVLVAMQWGREVGLGPLQAIQNVAVINGRPSIWGDAALALVRGHPACERVTEGVEGEGDTRAGFCIVKRRGEPEQRRTFSVADAKKAGLWGKAGPWQQYPDRMLQLRARGFAIRDVFPDALRGVITAEEAQDTPADPIPPARGATIDVTPPRLQTFDPFDVPLSAPAWKGMAWPICTRDGRCEDFHDPDAWEAELQKRIATVQQRELLGEDAKRKAIGQMLDANRGAMEALRERGFGDIVESVADLFRAALGETEGAANG
jgi:hypothetical protein